MKKRIYILLIPVLLSISACESFLDEQPISSLSGDNFWKLESDIQAGIAGMYDGIQEVVDDSFVDWGEGRSDNFINGGTGTIEINFALNGLTSDMATADWSQLYAVILRANLVLFYLPQLQSPDITDRERNHYLAQAYAARAFCHLWGVKVWGDVPIILEATQDRDAKPFRAPVSEVLDAVVADLNLARSLVDKNQTSVFQINIGGILAILADAYMWQKDYQKVIEVTDELIALNRYQLVSGANNWKNIFIDPANSKEPIWSLHRDVLNGDPGNGIANKIGSSDRTSSFVVDRNVLDRWQTQKYDFRRWLTYDSLDAFSEGSVGYVWKHFALVDPNVYEPDRSLKKRAEADIKNPMYRYAEMLLLRAEALNQLGDEPGAVALLNQVKSRANVPTVTEDMFNSVEELENAILDESQLELFAEGKRWYDLRRTGKVIEVMDPILRQRQIDRGLTEVGFGDPGLELFPIGRDVLNTNPNLVQNFPYSN